MDLIQEYRQQQTWRKWEQYFQKIPMNPTDFVVDLGCSVGGVSRLFSNQVSRVLGIDCNEEFVAYCHSRRRSNEQFECADFLDSLWLPEEKIDGLWSSFSLSYLNDPSSFLTSIRKHIRLGGWIALVDVSCFISGNLDRKSRYYDRVRQFELESFQTGVYDFNFGEKMQALLENVGFEVVFVNHDIEDDELSFEGAASEVVINNWAARLDRMIRLKELLGQEYSNFYDEFLHGLTLPSHDKRNNIAFVVAKNAA